MQTASVSSVSTYPTKSSDVAFGSLRIRTGDRGWPQECRLFGLSKAERECCASMSALGQSRRFNDVRVTSALPLIADLCRKDRHVRKVPMNEPASAGRAGGAVGRLRLPQ
jgi:hypothetical protein